MIKLCNIAVAPVWGRGLKYELTDQWKEVEGRSRVGAWIEILNALKSLGACIVAPVWGRGLKFC